MSSRLIVFDLDGTLVDSRNDLATSANLLLHDLGAPPLDVAQVSAMVGDGARTLVTRVLEAAHRPDVEVSAALSRFLDIYDLHLADHTRLYPGVREALDGLHGRCALAMLTNKPAHHTARLLDVLDVGRYFSLVIAGDVPLPRKPDPAGLLHIIDASGASVATTLMVGDSIVDVETARRAGTHLALARYGFGRRPATVELDAGDIDLPVSTDLAQRLAPFLS